MMSEKTVAILKLQELIKEIANSNLEEITKKILIFLILGTSDLSYSCSVFFKPQYTAVGAAIAHDMKKIDWQRFVYNFSLSDRIQINGYHQQTSVAVFDQTGLAYSVITGPIKYYDDYQAQIEAINIDYYR